MIDTRWLYLISNLTQPQLKKRQVDLSGRHYEQALFWKLGKIDSKIDLVNECYVWWTCNYSYGDRKNEDMKLIEVYNLMNELDQKLNERQVESTVGLLIHGLWARAGLPDVLIPHDQ